MAKSIITISSALFESSVLIIFFLRFEILSKCIILVFDRNKYKRKSLKSIAYKKYNKKRLKYINFKKINISSSQLRKI